MAPDLEGKSIGLAQKTLLKGELLIWRTKNQARDQCIVQLKDSICFKSVQIAIISLHLQHWIASAVDKQQLLIVTPQVPASAL
jgi:hypothetical protein